MSVPRIPVALLQLASPMLPVGAYAYSQGIERAVEDGVIMNEAGARRWILDLLAGPVAHFEAPVWLRLHRAAVAGDVASLRRWNDRYLASRETSELRAETLQMGASLRELAKALGLDTLLDELAPTFATAHAASAKALGLDAHEGLVAYVWGWIENQVAATLKAVPLGQVAGQRLLLDAHPALAGALDIADGLADDDLVSSAPGLALTCALHEVQYSRLFRS